MDSSKLTKSSDGYGSSVIIPTDHGKVVCPFNEGVVGIAAVTRDGYRQQYYCKGEKGEALGEWTFVIGLAEGRCPIREPHLIQG